MKKLWIMAVAMTVGVSFTVNAQNWVWTGGEDVTNWTDATAWGGGDGGDYPGHTGTQALEGTLNGKVIQLLIDSAIPNSLGGYNNFGTDSASIGSTLTVLTGGSVTINDSWISRNGGSFHIDINGGSYIATGLTRLASGSTGSTGTSGEITVRNGGTMSVMGNFLVGRNLAQTAIVNIEDGIFSVGGDIAADTVGLVFGDNMYITLNKYGGAFRWTGDRVIDIMDLQAINYLRAGAGMTFEDPVYDSGEGYTELRVIPEPGTIALLGLAGLVLLIRRRRSVK